MAAVCLEDLYVLKNLERRDKIKEGIKFNYSNIIGADCNILAQALMKCGLNSIQLRLTTGEKKELFEKRVLETSKVPEYLRKRTKKDVIKTYYGGILTKETYDFTYLYEFETKKSICNYGEKQECTINLKGINQLNPYSDGYHKIKRILIHEFISYLRESIAMLNNGISYNEKYEEIKKSLNSLFHLNELEEHIKILVDKIEKSDLRNYTDIYQPNNFGKELIFKIYRGDEPYNLLKKEFVAINFFNTSPHSRKMIFPSIYCHGQLGDFYILIMGKIEGATLDKYIKNLEGEQRLQVVNSLLYDIIKIGVDGRIKNLPTLYGELTERKIYKWLKKGVVEKLSTKKSIGLLQKIKENYHKISELLLGSSFFYNKDIPTGNWLVKNKFLSAIDFENTHFGPIQLDLVTLFEGKNNIELEENELIQVLRDIPHKINSYISENDRNFPILNEEDFIKTYFAASIHRNLSMAGTNKERNNQHQMIKHLKKAENSTRKLQNLIEDQNEKESLQNLGNIIQRIRFNLLQ